MDNMQLWLSSSTDSINLNDSAEGFYLNPDLEGLTGLPEIRSVNGLNAGYDGGWTATQLWAARLITIRGVIAINDKEAVETKRKALAKLLAQGKNEDLELKFVSEAGNTYTATVRTTSCTMALQRVFWRQEYQIQLRANDPLIYDDGGSELIAILRVMAGEGGFEIPFDIPFDIGGSITPTSIDVGDETTYPLIRLKGDLHSPTIINMTTNQQMQVLADIITTTEWHDYTTAYTIGGYTQINSAEDGAPLSLTKLTGNAEQKTLSGKNKANYLDAVPSSGTTTTTFIDNGFRSTTTASGYATKLNITVKPSTTYTLSCSLKIVSGQAYRITVFKGTTQTNTYGVVMTPSNGDYQLHFTTDAGESAINVWFYNGVPAQGTTDWTFIQLEESATKTDYEPYCGGIPSPNPDFPQGIKTVSGAQTVKITGKNLIDPSTLASSVFENTLTNVYYYDANLHLALKAGQTYTLSAYVEQIDATPYRFSALIGTGTGARAELGTTPNLTTVGGRVSVSFTVSQAQIDSAGGNNLFMRLPRYTSPTTTHYKISDIQLEFGSQPSAYEPYQGQSQEINLGKNLLPISHSNPQAIFADVTAAPNDDGTITLNGTANNNGWLEFVYAFQNGTVAQSTPRYILDVDKTYVFSVSVLSGVMTGTPSSTIQKKITSTESEVVVNFGESTTFTGSDGIYRGWIRVSTGQIFDNVKIGIQVEEGVKATPFSAYKTPVELCKIGTYQDYIWNDDGTWKIHKAINKIVLDGTVNNQFDGTFVATPNGFAVYKSFLDGDHYMGGVSDKFTSSNKSYPDMPLYSFIGMSGAVTTFTFILPSTITSKTDANNWLSTHNTTVYYALATPTDTEITDSELIEELNHIYELYQGTNNLWLIPSAGAQGEMEVTYATDKDVDYHEVVIDCQARTVTQDGQNLYPALAPGSEFIQLVPGQNRLYLTSTVSSDDGTAEVKFKKGNISI